MPTFLFAGGGTGGHLYPGLAIAEELRARAPEARCLFVCSDRPLDAKILSAAGVEFVPAPAKPFGVLPRALLRFARSWGPSVRLGRRLIADVRGMGFPAHVPSSHGLESPCHIVAMGGFVAAPIAQAARAEKAPLTLVNLDAVPGKANSWIARHADRVLAVAGSRGYPDWESIRPIVRAGAVAQRSAAECRTALGLEAGRRALFVTGGSQGADSINALMTALVGARPEIFSGWQVLHQSGEKSEREVQAAYDAAGVPARVMAFCSDMGLAWGAADLSLGRCGAGAVAEVWANSVPAVFLPYPYHRDEHQRLNAEPLARAGGAKIVTDRIRPDLNLEPVGRILAELLLEPERLVLMRQALRALGPADGAAAVASRLLDRCA